MKFNLNKIKRFLRKRSRRQYLKWGRYAALFILLYSVISYLTLPDCSELKKKNPAQSKLMEVRINQAKYDNKPFFLRHTWVGIDNISMELKRAVVASEDFSFSWHEGFDLEEKFKVFKEFIFYFHSLRGASTITQQLAKNLYLADSWILTRKFKEIVLTNRLEKNLSKRRILELYLNFVEWADGVFGAEAAARHYFNKSARDLNRQESLFLAAILPSPRQAHNPNNPGGNIVKRSKIIEGKLSKLILEGV